MSKEGQPMFGRIYGYDVYGQPDFVNTEAIGDLPKCMTPGPGNMPLEQAPIFRQMSKEGFLRGKYSINIVRPAPRRADDQCPGEAAD